MLQKEADQEESFNESTNQSVNEQITIINTDLLHADAKLIHNQTQELLPYNLTENAKNFIEQSENTVFLKEVLPYNLNENADINTDLLHKQQN